MHAHQLRQNQCIPLVWSKMYCHPWPCMAPCVMHGTMCHACIPFIEYVYALKMLGCNDISNLHTPCLLFFKQDTEKGGHKLCVFSDWLQLSASASMYQIWLHQHISDVFLLLLLVFLYQSVIIWYAHVFNTQYTRHSFISSDHLMCTVWNCVLSLQKTPLWKMICYFKVVQNQCCVTSCVNNFCEHGIVYIAFCVHACVSCTLNLPVLLFYYTYSIVLVTLVIQTDSFSHKWLPSNTQLSAPAINRVYYHLVTGWYHWYQCMWQLF